MVYGQTVHRSILPLNNVIIKIVTINISRFISLRGYLWGGGGLG